MRTDFAVGVLGLGLIGSAAVRHVASDLVASGGAVVGIGPTEPALWSSHKGVFASHYDSGRVTRRLDARREWSVLASRSIDQYGPLEERSGLTFHHPVGMVYVRRDHAGVERQRAVASEFQIPVADGVDVAPYVFPDGWTCLHEPGPAGHIDPRVMIEAQHYVAVTDGATIVDDEVQSVKHEPRRAVVTTRSGVEFTCDRIIVATGAYGDHLMSQRLALSVRPEAVILAEVAEDIAAASSMPSAIWLLDHAQLDDIYIVPPVRYPDGRWYVKMGAANSSASRISNAEEANRWMAGSDADVQLAVMRDVLTAVLPAFDFLSFSMKPCLITDSVSGLPYVGIVDNGVVVVRGGNGHAAKSADALGALAGRLALSGEWTDSELDEAMFLPQFGDVSDVRGSRHAT